MSLYAWGLVGTKGPPLIPVKEHVDSVGHCIYPTKVRLPTTAPVTSVSADMGVFAALSSEGELVAWGSQPFNAEPSIVAVDIAVCEVTSHGIAAITAAGEAIGIGPLFSFTSTKSSTIDMEPFPISAPLLEGDRFIGVAACARTVVAWTIGGAMYGIGAGITNGFGRDTTELRKVDIPLVRKVALGSRHGAAIGLDGLLYVWGDGLSGNLGLGDRRSHATPQPVTTFESMGLDIIDVGCTRGQFDPKRSKATKGGEEGPRCHVITSDGKLWVAGTSHKGLGANHLHKTMQPPQDLLDFYCVSGLAADASVKDPVPTGAAEDLLNLAMRQKVAWRMGMKDVSLYGEDGATNYLTDCSIVASIPSHIHSLALAADGRLFAWGCGSDGRLGLAAFMRGPGASKRTLKCYVSTPSLIEAIETRNVLSIAVGRYWSLAVLEE